jgi:hypothetical protein
MPVIPSTEEAEMGRITAWGQPGRQTSQQDPTSIQKPGMAMGAWGPNCAGGHKYNDHSLRPAFSKTMKIYLKNN